MPFLKFLYGRTLNSSTTSILCFYEKNVDPIILEYKTTCFMFYKTSTQQTLTCSSMLTMRQIKFLTCSLRLRMIPESSMARVRVHTCRRVSWHLWFPGDGGEKNKPHSRVVFSKPVRIVHDDSEILGEVFDIISWWNYSWNPLIFYRSRRCCPLLIPDSFLSSQKTTPPTTTTHTQT